MGDTKGLNYLRTFQFNMLWADLIEQAETSTE